MSKEMFLRREGLINIVEFYSHRKYALKKNNLSKEQRKQLTEVKNRLLCFGEVGKMWANFAQEILAN